MDEFIRSLTVSQLRKILELRNLSISYRLKVDLVKRLKDSLTAEDTENTLWNLLFLEEDSDVFEDSLTEDMSTTNFTFKDVDDALEKFSGESERNIETWLLMFEAIATTCKWNDVQKYLYARKLLIGAAKLAIEGDDTLVDYALLKAKLQNDFKEKLTLVELHEKMTNRKKLASETFLEYFYAMQKVGKGKMDAMSTIHYIVNGIPDNPSEKIILYDAQTLEELKIKLKTYETVRNQRKTTSSNVKPPFRKFQNSMSQEASSSSQPNIRCFNCGSRSHQRNDCPDKSKGTRCFNCNQFGHRAKECREKKTEVTSLMSAVKAKPNRAIVKLPEPDEAHIYVGIGRDQILYLVDSGSHVTVMKKSIFYGLKQRPELKQLTTPFKGFGNIISRALGTAEFLFEICDDTYDVECHIVEDDYISDDMLIGLDIINQAQLIMIRGTVTLKKLIDVCEENDEKFIGQN